MSTPARQNADESRRGRIYADRKTGKRVEIWFQSGDRISIANADGSRGRTMDAANFEARYEDTLELAAWVAQ